MRRFILLPLTLALLTASAHAATIHVGVKGLVCAFCATGLEKTFGKEPAIESVKVDLENKLVTLKTKDDETLSDDAIKQRITDAGFTITTIHREK